LACGSVAGKINNAGNKGKRFRKTTKARLMAGPFVPRLNSSKQCKSRVSPANDMTSTDRQKVLLTAIRQHSPVSVQELIRIKATTAKTHKCDLATLANFRLIEKTGFLYSPARQLPVISNP
jgi:hypothetical protein